MEGSMEETKIPEAPLWTLDQACAVRGGRFQLCMDVASGKIIVDRTTGDWARYRIPTVEEELPPVIEPVPAQPQKTLTSNVEEASNTLGIDEKALLLLLEKGKLEFHVTRDGNPRVHIDSLKEFIKDREAALKLASAKKTKGRKSDEWDEILDSL